MFKQNALKNKLTKGEEVIGTWASLSSPNVINVLGTTQLDFVVIDMEHGSMSFETAENMVRAAESSNISPIIRVGNDDEQTILRALECDAQSILVPHVKSAAQAEQVSKNCRYYPEGNRGLSPYTRVHNFTHDQIDKSLKKANKEMLVGILVEGEEGLKNLDEIVKVEGIDLIYLGLFDICQSVGLPGQLSHPTVLEEIARCQKVISKNNIVAGSMSTDVTFIEMLRSKNYQFIAYLNDAASIKTHFEDVLSSLK
tara:strand:+ start:3287 stop:4051 length:765 start_codon:yes stop_codon:yes gene_type:complete